MTVVTGIGIYLPEKRHDAAHIARASGVPEHVVRDKMGITQKTVPGPDDHTNAMGVRAARAALAEARVQPMQIDALICMTEEHKEYPVWTAGIEAAHDLGAERAWAFDVGQKCGTAVLGLKLAADLMKADRNLNAVLLAGGYRNGDLVDYSDPNTRFLNNLAAGGGAAVIQRDGPGFEILGSSFRTDGSFSEDVIVPVGGTRHPITPRNVHEFRLQVPDPAGMKRRLEAKSLDNFVTVIDEACARSGITSTQAKYVALLHMKRSAHDEVLRRIGVPGDRSIYLSDYGHIGQVDVLLSLKLAREEGRFADGDVCVLAAAGIGYVWNAICVRYRA
ncbi:MAG TPA: 3-oxoacyl-ACP synthase [Nevskiaceae bacterium]|nr:3-oxoacyl-ACP synthase [Nevskiaceae bacterium]